MIRTRFGSCVEITANCGDITNIPGRDPGEIQTLVLTEIPDPLKPDQLRISAYRLTSSLRADRGQSEIDEAVSKAPTIVLNPSDLNNAFQEALLSC